MVSHSERPPSLHWLTVLRYPAAVWVIIHHSLGALNVNKGGAGFPDSLGRTAMERGYLGVSFFFMLSGFILAYNYPVIASKRDYLSARAARILPVYYLSLLFALPIMIVENVKTGFRATALVKTFLTLTLLQSWVPYITSFWNSPAWTLSCEAFFYTSLLFILAPLTRFCLGAPARVILILTACFAIGLIAPTFYHHRYPQFSLAATMAVPDPRMYGIENMIVKFPALRILEFVAGAVLCLGVRAHLHKLSKFSVIFILMGIAQVFSSFYFPFIFSEGTYCLPGFALIILGAAALPFPNLKTSGKAVRSLALLGILLGNASYAVYLFHASVIYYLISSDRHLFPILPADGPAYVWAIAGTVTFLTTLLSIATFHFYEEPARKLVKSWLAQVPDDLFAKRKPPVTPELEERPLSAFGD